MDFNLSTLAKTAAVIVGGAVLLPVLYLALQAVHSDAGLVDSLLRAQIAHLLMRTTALAIAVTGASVVIALPLAWLTTRSDLPFKEVWAGLVAVPLAIPSYIGAFTLIAALGTGGMLQQFLSDFLGWSVQLPQIYGFPGAFVVLTLFTYPYVLLNLRSAFMRLDPAMQQAARTLGHSRWSAFWRVTIPQLRPAIASGCLLVALYTVRDFGAVSMLQYSTFTRAIYIQYQMAFDRTQGAVLGLILVLLSLGIVFLESRMRRQHARYYSVGSEAQSPGQPVKLGAWKWPALIFCAAVVCLSLGIPAATVMYWLVRGLASGEQLSMLILPALNTVGAASAAAVFTAIAALPVTILAVREPSAFSEALMQISYLGFALPGIVIALALTFLSTRLLHPLYQTFAILIFGYTVQFLPQAGGAIKSSLLQVNPRLQEVAFTLGKDEKEVFTSVTWPLISPGVTGGATLVFLTAVKELPMALLLAPTGFETLSTLVWGATQEAFYARAALPALLLMTISAASMIALNTGIRKPRGGVSQ